MHLRQFVTFAAIGASGVLVNMLVVIVCNRTGPPPDGVVWPIPHTPWSVRWYHLYATAAFLVANVWNFVLNRRLTFRTSRHMSVWSQYWPFFLVGAAGAAVGLLIITLLMNPTSPLYLGFAWLDGSTGFRTRLYWANLISIIVVTPVTFVLNKVWSFAAHRVTTRPAT